MLKNNFFKMNIVFFTSIFSYGICFILWGLSSVFREHPIYNMANFYEKIWQFMPIIILILIFLITKKLHSNYKFKSFIKFSIIYFIFSFFLRGEILTDYFDIYFNIFNIIGINLELATIDNFFYLTSLVLPILLIEFYLEQKIYNFFNKEKN